MSNLPKKNDNNSLVNHDNFAKEIGDKKNDAQLLLKRKVTLLQRIFPTVEQKETIKHSAAILEQESKSDLEKRRMHNEFFNQALQATFDKYLTEGAESIQKGLTSNFAANKAALDKEIVNLTKNYFNQMEIDEEDIFKMKSENMKTRQMKMLNDRIDEFERTIQNLMQKYEDATNKSVGKKD